MTDVTRSIFFAERIIANVTDLRERASKYIRSWGKHAHNAKASATSELLKTTRRSGSYETAKSGRCIKYPV